MKDGDLWQVFADLMKQRGSQSVWITKVKGPATKEMVEEGKVELDEKRGNDGADKAADMGAKDSQEKVHRFGEMSCLRHKCYRTLMCRIQHFVVGLKMEEKRMKRRRKLKGLLPNVGSSDSEGDQPSRKFQTHKARGHLIGKEKRKNDGFDD